MLKFYITVIQNGLNLALLVAASFAVYRPKQSRATLLLARYLLPSLAVLAGINTYLRQVPHLINRPRLTYYSNLFLLVTGLFFLIALFLWPATKEVAHRKYFPIALCLFNLGLSQAYLPGLFQNATRFSSYGESYTFTDMSLRVSGYILGWLVLFATAILLYIASLRLEIRFLRRFVVAAILIDGVATLNSLVLRWYQLKLIPRSRIVFSILAFVTNNATYIIYLIIAVLLAVPLYLYLHRIGDESQARNKAEVRKIRAQRRNAHRLASFLLAFFIVGVLTLSVIKAIHEREIPLSPPEEYELKDETALIPLSLLEDGHLHRFAYKSKEGYDVRFICLLKSPGSYAACFDACEICGASGYFERKDDIVCKLCDVVMNRGTIGFKGGCNPIPMPFIIEDGYLKIASDELEVEASRFR
ncbi:MAG: Fe-S-containing protein [Eubacteriales bacterium]|nr:Fe-S-containing protein [Eubacteriales bacterium]